MTDSQQADANRLISQEHDTYLEETEERTDQQSPNHENSKEPTAINNLQSVCINQIDQERKKQSTCHLKKTVYYIYI